FDRAWGSVRFSSGPEWSDDPNPRELHLAQWSQGLPLGSTEHCFSVSKNSTNSDTAASSTPNLSWLGWSAACGLAWPAREKGASQGDCATGGTKVECDSR